MADEKQRDWVDTVSKLLIPIVIFAAGFWFSFQKDKNDRANQKFERDSGILRLAASSNEAERVLGLKMLQIEVSRGTFTQDMLPVVEAISQGRPGDPATQTARNILVTAKEQDPTIAKQIQPTPENHTPTVYLQIAREEQRDQAALLRSKLGAAGFTVPGIELVSRGTVNTYVRYFSATDKPQAAKIVGLMQQIGFNVAEQDFTASNQGKVPSGQIEVWIGDKQGPLTTQ